MEGVVTEEGEVGVVVVVGLLLLKELELPPKKSSRSVAIELLAVLVMKDVELVVGEVVVVVINESKSNEPGV